MTARCFPAVAGMRRIAIFRALQLGDMLCAVPALRALRHAAPQAHITLIGLPNAAGFAQRFSHLVDELMVFPGVDGMPEQPSNPAAMPAFLAHARSRAFDLAIQLHGTGPIVNDIVAQLGATCTAGYMPAGEPPPTPGFMTWPDHLHEIRRYTALMEHLGIPAADTALEFPLTAADHAECQALLDATGLDPTRTVLVHAGARLASRRWPVARFAAVAQDLAAQGLHVAITGSADERSITRDLIARLPFAVTDLTGATSLGALAALVARCRLVISNDTGMSHVAAAVHTPSVIVASGSDVRRWAPLNAARHPVLWHDAACRPCAHDVCPLPGHPCASGVAVDAVIATARRQLARTAHGGLHA